MEYRPGTLDYIMSYIDSIPDKGLQQKYFNTVRDEINRLNCNKYLPDEHRMFDTIRKLAQGINKQVEQIAMDAFNQEV